jgi:sulfur-carrier protein adenylyltransferase/sulfurtransferase
VSVFKILLNSIFKRKMVKEITVQEVKKALDTNANVLVIDVREQHEVDAANFGATHIPMGEIMERTAEIPTNIPVYIHCRSGSRSAAVCNALMNNGYNNVYNVKGGIMAWSKEIDTTLAVH